MLKNEIYPYDEGLVAALKGIPESKNPYKCPNITRTDLVKSDAWMSGYIKGKFKA